VLCASPTPVERPIAYRFRDVGRFDVGGGFEIGNGDLSFQSVALVINQPNE
jgi:hypothetical protein